MSKLDEKKRVISVVVTFNRKELLLECLEAIKMQTHPVSKILLIDNASTDGTYEAVKDAGFFNDQFEYVKMESNTGGSGGFYNGIKICMKYLCDWVWIMDDDTIPANNSLEELLKGISKIKQKSDKEISFVASTVYGENEEYMNVPMISQKPSSNGYSGWYRFLADGVVEISEATFVSVLINSDAIKKYGLPCKDFFIWGDDTEYTKRLTTFYGPGYFIGNSRVIHKRLNVKAIDIKNEEDINRLKMYHYLYRNNAITDWYYKKRGVIRTILANAICCLKIIRKKHSLKKIKQVISGTFEACFEYNRFKKILDSQIYNENQELNVKAK